MDALMAMISCYLLSAKMAVKDFLNDEEGDTNFISIAIILIVIIGIAIIFITMGNEIKNAVSNAWNNLKSALGI